MPIPSSRPYFTGCAPAIATPNRTPNRKLRQRDRAERRARPDTGAVDATSDPPHGATYCCSGGRQPPMMITISSTYTDQLPCLAGPAKHRGLRASIHIWFDLLFERPTLVVEAAP